MILFVSGRCDIPAFYSEWFINRLKAGFVDVRNPYDSHQISRIPLTKGNVDALLFCTKNPQPMLKRLHEIQLPYLFHITLTSYHNDLEPHVPDKQSIIRSIQTLSQQIGKERVIVRYDPILLNSRYTIDYHQKAFASLLKQLAPYINTVIFSFIDLYKNTQRHQKELDLQPLTDSQMRQLAQVLSDIARPYGIMLQTCGESIDLSDYGIKNGACISKQLMEALLKRPYDPPIGKAVRACNCLPTVDIGDYNACPHFCRYCYANYEEQTVKERCITHDPEASVLLGQITPEDHITVRKEKQNRQLPLF